MGSPFAGTMHTDAIRIDGLTKRYGDVLAIRDLDLSVEPGAVFGFLGPNGSGKSTTINVLLDLVRPTEGRVRIFGLDPQTDHRAVRERIGVLPEGYGLYDRLSARDHVQFAIEVAQSDDDPDEILGRVGLTDVAGRPAGGFSKGMRQRLALGVALVGRPDLLILDEPSSGLDPTGISEMRTILRQEVDRGATVFFSSHVLEQVEAICDRVGILSAGELVALDTVDGLRASTGADSTLVLSVTSVPGSLDLTRIEGVADVTVEDRTIRVACTDSSAKAEIISRVEATGVDVTDVDSETTSLEALFETYTGAQRPPEVET